MAPGLSRPAASVSKEPQVQALSVKNYLTQLDQLARELISQHACGQPRYLLQQDRHLPVVENGVRVRQQVPQHGKCRLIKTGQLRTPDHTMIRSGLDRAVLASDLQVNHGQTLRLHDPPDTT